MIVNEIFYSLQGEGFLAGRPSVFVRVAGCPLRCKWCDTKYALDDEAGDDYTIAEIVEEVGRFQTEFVVITGGEPMINAELAGLVRELKEAGKHITIETAGIGFVADLQCDLMSISPKLGNSAAAETEKERLDFDVLGRLIDSYDYQLKFVVDSQEDLSEILEVLEKVPNVDRRKVMLMPQAVTREELIEKSVMVAELCRQNGFVFCERLHILLWDNARGK